MKSINSGGLRTTIYKVDDLSAAKSWYAKAFGIEPYFDEPFYVGFNIGGYELGLLPEVISKPKTTNILSYWAVEDIYDAFDLMTINGAKELETPNDVGEGIMVALVKDPWDNVIGLIYNPFFKLNDETENALVEWAPFRINTGVSEKELLEASKAVELEFLVKQSGFIRRELIRKSKDEWADIIYWEDKASADKAMAATKGSQACSTYFELMDLESNPAPMEFYEVMNIQSEIGN